METERIAVTCECKAKKIILLDKLFLKDGTSGIVCEFDKSPLGYGICIRSSIGTGETVRRWIRRDEILQTSDVVFKKANLNKHDLVALVEQISEDEGDRTAIDYADAEPSVTEF